ncbi:MAG: Holliday junction branch migration protein RuvA [Clostridium sp.]|nr:Holliday junction branch migration protein RuvA [Clostridium sp.]MCM1458597.1 Holliday junction branch migration protein RuvA [Bacteroides sp.]
MIAYIKGTVEAIDCEEVVLDKDGIGFRIFTSQNVTDKLRIHDSVTLFTYMNVREDDISLYGFLTKEEQSVFKLLIGISGIGPKGALSILSTLTVDELRIAVLSEDHKAIAKANGIGAKTAQRVVIDLKDKFKLEDVLGTEDTMSTDEIKENDTVSEAALALTGLGYSNLEALRAIKKVNGYETMSVEELLKNSLKNMI